MNENSFPASDQGHLECCNVRKSFGSSLVMDEVSLEIQPKEFVTIVGPSGCGKTTLLNILAGFERPTSGEVLVDGRKIERPGADRGVVFQDYALFPWLTVGANVGYGLREKGWKKPNIENEVRGWLARVGLEDFASHYPHQLSGGMRQRVALIRVLANNPRILLMDEPFAALDAFTRTSLQEELERLWIGSKTTVVFVTHNIDEAIALGDRLVVMGTRPGRVKEVVEVSLPRPRDLTSQAFNEYRRTVTAQLRPELAE